MARHGARDRDRVGALVLGLGVQPPTPTWGGMLADGASTSRPPAWWPRDVPQLAPSWSRAGHQSVRRRTAHTLGPAPHGLVEIRSRAGSAAPAEGASGPRGTRALLRGGWLHPGRISPARPHCGTGPDAPSRRAPRRRPRPDGQSQGRGDGARIRRRASRRRAAAGDVSQSTPDGMPASAFTTRRRPPPSSPPEQQRRRSVGRSAQPRPRRRQAPRASRSRSIATSVPLAAVTTTGQGLVASSRIAHARLIANANPRGGPWTQTTAPDERPETRARPRPRIPRYARLGGRVVQGFELGPARPRRQHSRSAPASVRCARRSPVGREPHDPTAIQRTGGASTWGARRYDTNNGHDSSRLELSPEG